MTVKGRLTVALDFADRKGVGHEVYSYRKGDTWFVVKSGPKYSNTYQVTETDEGGLAWLQAHELKE